MNTADHNRIIDCEKRLMDAFQQRDISSLDELFHEDVMFVIPNGQTLNKSQVLDNYRGGDMYMSSIVTSDLSMHFIGDNAVVSVNVEFSGHYYDDVINAKYRYIRVWKLFYGHWKVISVGGIPIT